MDDLTSFIELGRYFGYPDCCIEAFLDRLYTPGDVLEDSNKVNNKMHGTGYVPCPDCYEKSKEELISTIKANRICKEPFPKGRP